MPDTGCFDCAEWPSSIMAARYAFVLQEPASEIAHALKYEGWSRAADEMGRWTADAARDLPGLHSKAIAVPVPTTAVRVRQRGYNQAALIAAAAARELRLPYVEALERPSSSRSQTTLDPGQRRDNVRDAFRVAAGARSVDGSTVLLVDDVLTTGATAGAAADVLRDAGAVRVLVATFARALPRRTGAPARAA